MSSVSPLLAPTAEATATARATALPASTAARVPNSVEFLLVGGATLILFPLLWLLRRAIGLDSAELAVGFTAFHAAHLVNDPHFAVTYLLFYKNLKARALGREFSVMQRIRYVLVGLLVPLLLGFWLIVALTDPSARVMGALIQLMFLLVGWHYVKQGFGVFSVLSARHGVRFSRLERRAVLAHCFAGWAYAWANPAAAAVEAEEKGVIYVSLAHPLWLERLSALGFALSSVLLVVVLFQKWRRERRLPPLAPLSGLLLSIWVWSVYSSADPLLVYVIPALHSLQYLYFVWLLARNQAKAAEQPPFFGPSTKARLAFLAASSIALGWLVFHGFPELFDGIRLSAARHAQQRLGALGPSPYFAGCFAFVNIHHYAMDSVIWRRENPDTRYLLD